MNSMISTKKKNQSFRMY